MRAGLRASTLSHVRVLAIAVLLAGCTAQPVSHRGLDASVAVDARTGDDARIGDAGADASGADAGATDGGPIGAPCSVGGVSGTCELVSRCDGIATPGHCAGPSEVQCCTPSLGDAGACDPIRMPTPNEGLAEAPGEPGCPSGMVRVESFCIDRYEASLVLVSAGSWSPFHNPGTNRLRAVSIEGAIPQACVSATQAAAACAEAGKRLCTDDEWLRACRGTTGLTYPYGDAREDGACNDTRAVHPAVERFGTSADWIWSRLDDACIDQLPDSLAPAGASPGCVSAEGAFDLVGNLHEWTADPAGTFRGGYYVEARFNGEGCLYRTTAHDAGYWDYSTGFRCCADPI